MSRRAAQSFLLWVSILACAACVQPAHEEDAGTDADAGAETSDASLRDPGYDIPPEEWLFRGTGDVGGCYGRDLDRFVLQMETRDSSDAWCAYVSFTRRDGGFTPLFPEFDAPEDFRINDARWALTCGSLMLPDGGLNPAARPVHDFYGSMELTGFYMNRPRAAYIDAGIRVAYRVYQFAQLAGLPATCPGP